MKHLTRYELAAKNKTELHVLLRQSFNELAKSNPNTISAGTHWHLSKTSNEKLVQELGGVELHSAKRIFI
jgi:hypothetical protein